MKRGLAGILASARFVVLLLALAGFALATGSTAASAQSGPQCGGFQSLTDEAQKRGAAVSAAIKAKVDPKQICALMNAFIPASAAVLKYLTDNQTWCAVPQQAIDASKANHERSVKFRTMICSNDGPHQKVPTLSDAIKSTPADTAKNTKTGTGGAFDTLTGNPLAR